MYKHADMKTAYKCCVCVENSCFANSKFTIRYSLSE